MTSRPCWRNWTVEASATIAVIPAVSRPPTDYAGTKIVLLPISGAGRQQRARDLDDLGPGCVRCRRPGTPPPGGASQPKSHGPRKIDSETVFCRADDNLSPNQGDEAPP